MIVRKTSITLAIGWVIFVLGTLVVAEVVTGAPIDRPVTAEIILDEHGVAVEKDSGLFDCTPTR